MKLSALFSKRNIFYIKLGFVSIWIVALESEEVASAFAKSVSNGEFTLFKKWSKGAIRAGRHISGRTAPPLPKNVSSATKIGNSAFGLWLQGSVDNLGEQHVERCLQYNKIGIWAEACRTVFLKQRIT